MRYLQDMMDKVPDSIPKDERIWFALAAYNMGYAHMLDAMALTRKQKGNPNSWADVAAFTVAEPETLLQQTKIRLCPRP